MLPNPQYYGSENEWLKASTKPYASTEAANKIPPYVTIQSGISDGHLQKETPLDLSICYACIADDSPIAQLEISKGDGISIYNYSGEIDFFWGYVDTAEVLYTNRQINVNDLSSQSETDKLFLKPMSATEYPTNNIHRHFIPYVSIVPYNFVLVIYVEYANSDFSDTGASTLYDYIHGTYGKNPISHPYITSIRVAPTGGNDLTSGRSFFAINNNGAVELAYSIPIDLSLVSDINEAYDYWINATGTKTLTRIWGKKRYTSYANYTDIVNGKDGQYTTNSSGEKFYYKEFDLDWVYSCVASLGLFFTSRRDYAETEPLDSEYIYCGIIDDNGRCHGEYTHGSDNRNQAQYSWESTNDSKYDPVGDPNKYSDETLLPTLRDYAPTYRTYIDDAVVLSQGGYLLNSIISEVAGLGTMSWESFFIGQEPLSNIISVKRIFMSPPATTQDTFEVQMGSYTFEHVRAKMLVGEWSREQLRSVPIWRRYENFMDYEPYTTISLYIPYCGTVKLPCQVFMGHNCNITINRNNRSGLIEAVVMVDNIEFCSLKGDTSMNMAVSGLAMSEYITKQKEIQIQKDNLFFSSFNSLMGYAAGATISASMGNVGGVVTQGAMAANSIVSYLYQSEVLTYQLDHMAPEQLLIQKADSSVAALNVLTPYIFIERPVFEDGFDDTAKKTYSKTVGHACYRVGNLSDFHGLTVCGSVTLDGISCTLDEKLKIIALLKGGVILD